MNKQKEYSEWQLDSNIARKAPHCRPQRRCLGK